MISCNAVSGSGGGRGGERAKDVTNEEWEICQS